MTRGDKVKAYCSDGQVRTATIKAEQPDTWFSIPASVSVKGKTVGGYITPAEKDESKTWQFVPMLFIAYTYGKNGYLLPGITKEPTNA